MITTANREDSVNTDRFLFEYDHHKHHNVYNDVPNTSRATQSFATNSTTWRHLAHRFCVVQEPRAVGFAHMWHASGLQLAEGNPRVLLFSRVLYPGAYLRRNHGPFYGTPQFLDTH